MNKILTEVEIDNFEAFIEKCDNNSYNLYVHNSEKLLNKKFEKILSFLLNIINNECLFRNEKISVVVEKDKELFSVSFNGTKNQVELDEDCVLKYLFHILNSCKYIKPSF